MAGQNTSAATSDDVVVSMTKALHCVTMTGL
jgi:hypothetical protein